MSLPRPLADHFVPIKETYRGLSIDYEGIEEIARPLDRKPLFVKPQIKRTVKKRKRVR